MQCDECTCMKMPTLLKEACVFEPASCGVTCFADSISYTVRFATTSVQHPHPKGAS